MIRHFPASVVPGQARLALKRATTVPEWTQIRGNRAAHSIQRTGHVKAAFCAKNEPESGFLVQSACENNVQILENENPGPLNFPMDVSP